jgi:hypothetical protein
MSASLGAVLNAFIARRSAHVPNVSTSSSWIVRARPIRSKVAAGWGWKDIFPPVASSVPMYAARSNAGNARLHRGHSRGRHIDCTRCNDATPRSERRSGRAGGRRRLGPRLGPAIGCPCGRFRRGAPRRARVPPIGYGDGLAPHLTPTGNTEITKCIQRCPQHTAPY